MSPSSAALQALPALPRDLDGPVFKEPWEAQAFALAVSLSDAGCFSWPEWLAQLSEEIRTAAPPGEPDQDTGYYQHWLQALERLCVARGLVSSAGLRERKEAWRRAYLHTPHGAPVELSAAGHRRSAD